MRPPVLASRVPGTGHVLRDRRPVTSWLASVLVLQALTLVCAGAPSYSAGAPLLSASDPPASVQRLSNAAPSAAEGDAPPSSTPKSPGPGAANSAPSGQGPSPALSFSGQISGTVYSQSRDTLSGTAVAVVGSSGDTIRGSSTDERGHYVVKGLEKDEYSVLVMDPSGALIRKDRVNVRPLFRNLVDFILAPPGAPLPPQPSLPGGSADPGTGFTLEVMLSESDGSPVPEAWVTVAHVEEGAPARRARTDARGTVTLDSLAPGYYRLAARALGHVTWSLGPVLLQGDSPKKLQVSLLPFPLGHEERVEDLIVPVEPATPGKFLEESPPSPAAESDPPGSDSTAGGS